MTADIIGLIAMVTLALVVIGVVLLPYLAAMNHVPYELNQTIITGAIAALSGIISAAALKKIQAPTAPNTCSPDAKPLKIEPPADDKS